VWPGALAGADASRWRLIAAIALAAALLAGLLALVSPIAIRRAPTCGSAEPRTPMRLSPTARPTREIPERAAATNLPLASLDTVAGRVARQFPGVTAGELKDSVPI